MSKAIWGGVLTGLGQGMVSQAEQMRKDALERAKMLQRTEERAEDRKWRQEDMATQFANQQTIADKQHTQAQERDNKRWERDQQLAQEKSGQFGAPVGVDDDGNLTSMAPDGSTLVLEGIKPKPSSKGGSADNSGLSAGDARLIRALEDKHFDDVNRTTDYQAVAQDLIKSGRADLAKSLGFSPGQTGQQRGLFNPEIWSEARKMAESSAEEKDPWGPNSWRPDAMKKEYGEGGKESWTRDEALRNYREMGGRFGDSQAQSGGDAKPPGELGFQGKGTPSEPLEIKTESDMDRLMTLIDQGVVLESTVFRAPNGKVLVAKQVNR